MRNTTFLLCLLMPLYMMAQQSEVISLNEGWQFTQTNNCEAGDDHLPSAIEWYDASVPGSVQLDLIRHGILPDPFYGTNESKVQWVEEEDWDFKKTFTVTAAQLEYDEALICFDGLDTHADVFLNGSRILRSENMFVGHRVPVRNMLTEGDNELYIRFYSPIEMMMPARASFGYDYPAGNDHREEKLSVYNRKAPYHFGWDWGIRIVQIGIWKPVSMLFYNDALIEDYYVKQHAITAKLAKIENQIEVTSVSDAPFRATLTVEYNTGGGNSRTEQQQVVITKGMNRLSLPMEIADPL